MKYLFSVLKMEIIIDFFLGIIGIYIIFVLLDILTTPILTYLGVAVTILLVGVNIYQNHT